MQRATPETKHRRVQRMVTHESCKTQQNKKNNEPKQFFIQILDNATILGLKNDINK